MVFFNNIFVIKDKINQKILCLFANLLARRFPKSNLTTQPLLVKWNAHNVQGSILNVDGSSLENPGV